MAQAGSILTNIRKICGDPDSDFVDDTTGLTWLDKAQQRFCDEVLALDEIKDYAITAKISRYDLPTDTITPVAVMWFKSSTRRLAYEPPDLWYKTVAARPNATGTPSRYTVLRRQLLVGPEVPQTASAGTTASGAMTAAVTTLNLLAASGTFRSNGFVKIEDEIIEYTTVATSTLTGAVRGVHGTTAASHASGTTVSEIDFQMTYRKTPTALATGASPEIPAPFHRYLEQYALYLAWLARGDSAKAAVALEEFKEMEQSAKKSISRRAMDGVLKIQNRRFSW